MSIIKEFREFYLRHNVLNTGFKKDREVAFPTKYMVNINGSLVEKFNRFLKGDYPSKTVFEKLFESISFKLNVEDTSTTTEQGLSKVASTTDLTKGTDNDASGYNKHVIPSQVPLIYFANVIPTDFTNYKVNDLIICNDPSNVDFEYGNVYRVIELTPGVKIPFLVYNIYSLLRGGTLNQVLTKNGSDDFDYTWANPYRYPFITEYVAIVSQDGGATNPSVDQEISVLDRVTSIITFARIDVGEYTLDSSEPIFEYAKTKFTISNCSSGSIFVIWISTTQFSILTSDDSGVAADGILSSSVVNITIYP